MCSTSELGAFYKRLFLSRRAHMTDPPLFGKQGWRSLVGRVRAVRGGQCFPALRHAQPRVRGGTGLCRPDAHGALPNA